MIRRALLGCLFLTACATSPTAPSGSGDGPVVVTPLPDEKHFGSLRQLTFGGENAEAYWSFDGKELIFQRRFGEQACDRIYRMSLAEPRPSFIPVSSGKGATTCSYHLPGEDRVIFASTHLGGDACPPKPDHSQGYVWALYDSYDIFSARPDGSELTALTSEKGYDAEATVCSKDGSIVFTSVRDGDVELYRMDKDGKNVKRLTSTPGYDGGAFFNQDCTKLVWRASRPKPGKELEDYQRLLSQGLVRPSKLELYVANADGTEARQITYLNAAAFGPAWFPNQDRIIFSSNHGDPKGREFDLWAINADGTSLERITHSPGFDGFPMFSPDGKTLAFSSNRATAPGASDTNVFLASWVDWRPTAASEVETSPADRVAADVAWLADPARTGRGAGTVGLEASGAYLERRFKEIGLEPFGDEGGYRQAFELTTAIEAKPESQAVLGGVLRSGEDFVATGFSGQGTVRAPVVLAGHGISSKELGVDDYANVNAKGKIVLVRRFVPESEKFKEIEAQRRYGEVRHKAWVAREKGAVALVVVDAPLEPADAPKDWKAPTEAKLPSLRPEGFGDAGLPVVFVRRAGLEKVLEQLSRGKSVPGEVTVGLTFKHEKAFNVVGRLPAAAPEGQPLPQGTVVIGAHYDHLGMGGVHSLAPEKVEAHLGADDNASGTSALLEVARTLKDSRSLSPAAGSSHREVVFVAFSGEESGLLGSTAFTRSPPNKLELKNVVAMLNMDMVGRLRANTLTILGAGSGEEWPAMLEKACGAARVACLANGDGYGPSDQTPFYAGGVPVLHFFTGVHSDYHKPSDEPSRINAAGLARVAMIVSDVTQRLADSGVKVTYRNMPSPAPRGDLRSFNASLGTVPDYAGPPQGQKGMLLSGVRPGSAAELAGLKRGDVLIRLGKHAIGSVEDLMYVLNASKPGETVTAVVLREGKEVSMEATFQESKRPR